jgi:hypothetical protein
VVGKKYHIFAKTELKLFSFQKPTFSLFSTGQRCSLSLALSVCVCMENGEGDETRKKGEKGVERWNMREMREKKRKKEKGKERGRGLLHVFGRREGIRLCYLIQP